MSAPRTGSLLVITLWLVTIITVLVVAIARYLSLEVRLTRYRLAREQARTLARSGVYLAMQRLEQDAREPEPGGTACDWLGDDWASFAQEGSGRASAVWVIPFPADTGGATRFTGQVEIEMIDQERKLDVNAATPTQLEPLLRSSDAVDAIMDYRDPDSEGAWEAPGGAPAYHHPKNGPVVTLEELRGIPGQTEETFERLGDFLFAVPQASPTLKVNINTAPREVLLAVGLPTLADEVLRFRAQGHYLTRLTPSVETESPAVPPPFDPANVEFLNAKDRLDVASALFAVRATGKVQSPPAQHDVEAVIRRSPDGLQILAWREG